MTDTNDRGRGEFSAQYGPWAVVLGASDGTGEEFANHLASRGIKVVVVARRPQVLAEVAARLDVETRVVPLDLSRSSAPSELIAATDDLEVGMFIANVGGDIYGSRFLDTPVERWEQFVQRNNMTTVSLLHHFGGRMVARGRGGVIPVSSGATWAGGSYLATYCATKAFDRTLAEGLWAEWREHGVDVLSLPLGATDTPLVRRILVERPGRSFGPEADAAAVTAEALDHIGDGPVWQVGYDDPQGPSPFGGMPRRLAAETVSWCRQRVRTLKNGRPPACRASPRAVSRRAVDGTGARVPGCLDSSSQTRARRSVTGGAT
jgi:short-subunit dehydrogenase